MVNPKIKLFADGADLIKIKKLYEENAVMGFTTNPTLMRKAGVKNYKAFALELLDMITDLPKSFEVFSDDFDQMEKEARVIHSWGSNVFIKIPVTNTQGKSTVPLIKRLVADGLKLNVTAVLTIDQIEQIIIVLDNNVSAVISVFAGRIADTGRNPVPIMKKAVEMLDSKKKSRSCGRVVAS